eukprot:scaffold664480_cov47-Prasinocladus_malaysianus.AAC.1
MHGHKASKFHVPVRCQTGANTSDTMQTEAMTYRVNSGPVGEDDNRRHHVAAPIKPRRHGQVALKTIRPHAKSYKSSCFPGAAWSDRQRRWPYQFRPS